MPVLHVVVPVYNESATLAPCLARVLGAALPDGWSRHVHLVDDHSDPPADDAVIAAAATVREAGHAVTLHRHDRNRGKGAAIRTAFDGILDGSGAEDDLVVIQDADLEYDPADYAALMAPILGGGADAVIGNRWHGPRRGGGRRLVHLLGNRVLTVLSNAMTGYRVHDMECCYKVLTVALLRRLRPMLGEPRFGIEPQIVAGLARLGARVREVPVHYSPRGRAAGKKIGWRDGVRALWVIARERMLGPGAPAAGERAR